MVLRVTGSGTVAAKNTTSRAGTLTVVAEGENEVTVQIGPVVRVNSTRHALPFVSFEDLTT